MSKSGRWKSPIDEARHRRLGRAVRSCERDRPQVRLAKRIARHVAIWRDKGGKPGDVLILVRQRGALFEEIIRALKDADIPVAGADRLVLTEHIAIMDLIALADALLLPEDDLALAAVLKSPLFGLTEERSVRHRLGSRRAVAARGAACARQATIREAADAAEGMRARRRCAKAPSPSMRGCSARAAAASASWRGSAPEANDALDEFLNLALDYEKRETPSLQGFVAWLRAAQRRGEARHGARARRSARHDRAWRQGPRGAIPSFSPTPRRRPKAIIRRELIALPLPAATVWSGPARRTPIRRSLPHARETALKAQGDEYRRLLYVAMTRASDRLVICGTSRPLKQDGTPSIPDECWYRLIDGRAARRRIDDRGRGRGRRNARPCIAIGNPSPWSALSQKATATRSRNDEAPAWLHQPVAADAGSRGRDLALRCRRKRALRRAGGKLEREQALERGRLMHRLIQSLPDIPPERRQRGGAGISRAAMARSSRKPTAMPSPRRRWRCSPIRALPACSRRAAAPKCRSSAPCPATACRPMPSPARSTGCWCGASEVLIADYKTNRPAPTDLRVDTQRL